MHHSNGGAQAKDVGNKARVEVDMRLALGTAGERREGEGGGEEEQRGEGQRVGG